MNDGGNWILLIHDPLPYKETILYSTDKLLSERVCKLCKHSIENEGSDYSDELFNFTNCNQEGSSHRYHRICLKKYILEKAHGGNLLEIRKLNIRCPDSNCGTKAILNDVKVIFGWKKYIQMKLKKYYEHP